MARLIRQYLRGTMLAFGIAAPLAMLIEVLVDLQQPVLMARILDIGVARRDGAYIVGTGAVMLLFTILSFLLGVTCSLLASKAAVEMSGRMRDGLLAKIQSLSFADVDALQTSSLLTRCTNDVMQVQNMVLLMLRGMVRSGFTFAGSVFMAIRLTPKLAPMFGVALPVILGAIALVLRRSSEVFGRNQLCLDEVNTVMREDLLGIRVVKAFALEQPLAERFAVANEELTRTSIRAQDTTLVLMPTVTLTMNLCVVAALWFGGRMVSAGTLEIGKIIALVHYLVQIAMSVMVAANMISNLSRGGASATRINDVLDRPPSLDRPVGGAAAAGFSLELRDVTFSYSRGSSPALSNVSLRIDEGERVALIGATGSGKSSLVALLPRLYDVTAGAVRIGGVDVRDWDLDALRRTVSLATQESVLFSGTVESNLRLGDTSASRREMETALHDAQASSFVNDLPEGLESRVEQRGRNFSGGQKQRLSVARTLLSPDAKILVFDDSMSAVDLKTEARMRAALASRTRGRTTIFVTQRVSTSMGCDRIAVLDFGRLVAVGTHAELARTSSLYRSIIASQLGEEALSYV